MPLREISANIRYKENCNYEASETQCNVLVPTQDVNISYSIVNADYTNRNVIDFAPTDANEHFYNDVLNLYISVTCNDIGVQSGSINVYYIKYNADRFESYTLLNKEPLLVDNHGSVAIAYQPHDFGSFYIEYNGNQNYNNAYLETEKIRIGDIPTLLNFTKQHPYFADVKDAIDMEVEVTDIYGNPVNYGVVTFINYLKYNIEDAEDGIEHVIGNPVLLADGHANITYSPIQAIDSSVNVYYDPATGNVGYLYDNKENMTIIRVDEDNYDELTDYVFPADFRDEHIPCLMYHKENDNHLHFVYDSDLELIKTKMELIKGVYNYDNAIYGTKWKYYLQSSDLTAISFLQPNALNLNAISDGKLTVDDDEFIHVQYGDYIKLEAKLLDIEGNHVPLEADEIEFIIKGTKVVVISDTLTDDHDANVEQNYSYIPYEKTFKGNYMEEFGSDTDVFVGDITELLSPGYYTIYAHLNMTKNANEEDITHTGSAYGNIKKTDYYQEVDSEKLYIQVEQDKTNYEISIDAPSQVGVRSVINPEPITAEISINEEYHSALIGKTCYFYIGKTNQEYATAIAKENGKLIAKLSTPISFGEAGDYPIYAYIKEGDYVYGSKSVHLFKKCSETKIIKARYNLVPDFNIQVIRSIFAGKAQVSATVENIYSAENPILNVSIDKNGVNYLEETYELNADNNSISIELNDLEADFYEVKGKVGFEKMVGENMVIMYGEEIVETFDINKAILTDYNDSIRNVPTHPAQNIIIKLNTNGTGFRTLDPNKIRVILEHDNGYRECSFSINENIITAICPIYRTGEYSIRATYEGSENFNALDNEPTIFFEALTVKGDMLMSRNEDGDIVCQIQYNNLHNGQYIFGTMSLYNFNGNMLQFPVLFDSTGSVIIPNIFEESYYAWQQYYRGELELTPYDDVLMNQLLNDEIPTIITNDDRNIDMLKAQIESLENEAIFTTYGEQIINGEINGINGN